jgi:flagellar basal body-associated protein FliL
MVVKNLSAKSRQSFCIILFSVIVIIVLCIVLGLTIFLSNQTSNMLSDCVVSTKEQAVEIALPFAQVYAQENNRIITVVACNVVYFDSRPSWTVGVTFKVVEKANNALIGQYYVFGYTVSIWADTGEIQQNEAQFLPYY